jgi:hypothetical protein
MVGWARLQDWVALAAVYHEQDRCPVERESEL